MESQDQGPVGHARGRINEVDQEIVRLLAARMKAVQEIGAAKGENPGDRLRDPVREKELFEVWSQSAETHGLSYTVHLPLDTALGSADEADRTASVGKCRRVIERMARLEPFGYILHLEGDHRGRAPSDDIPRWRANLVRDRAGSRSSSPGRTSSCRPSARSACPRYHRSRCRRWGCA